ncbi:DUF4167 domain-containing protein [Sphingomonas sp. GC_Shp_3]|uniref:DUF4167 domain-containing protein n=1 Tax=Sphingomonas sp. GC_Shp_3 TaxID=2937383 RepID=UPI00226A3839|nr:DUF4167 domain-containing protein [Sphingomonas sp. GC_Shp_3]
MINNRQAGRRRGRGGQQQRPQGGNSGRGQDTGNRIDNRARGNAAQLLEKYKALARDAQMQGDRVNIEYYLQFADHYFRVLAETRSRFEENNQAQQQGRRPGGANTFDQDEQDYEDEGEPAGNEQQPRQQNGNGHVQNGGHNGQGQQGNQTGQDGSQRGEGRGQYGDAQRGRGNDEERPRRVNAEGGERPQRQDRQDYRQERGTEDRRPQRDVNRSDGRQEMRAEEARPEQQPVTGSETAAIVPESSAVEAPQAEAPAAEPRRRGRPRRVLPAEGETAPTFDAGLLPPSLTAAPAPAPSEASEAAPAATDGEAEKPRRRRGRPPATAPVEA